MDYSQTQPPQHYKHQHRHTCWKMSGAVSKLWRSFQFCFFSALCSDWCLMGIEGSLISWDEWETSSMTRIEDQDDQHWPRQDGKHTSTKINKQTSSGKHATNSLSDWITKNFTFFKSFHVDSYGQMLDGDISPSLMALCVFFLYFCFHISWLCVWDWGASDNLCHRGTARPLVTKGTEKPEGQI